MYISNLKANLKAQISLLMMIGFIYALPVHGASQPVHDYVPLVYSLSSHKLLRLVQYADPDGFNFERCYLAANQKPAQSDTIQPWQCMRLLRQPLSAVELEELQGLFISHWQNELQVQQKEKPTHQFATYANAGSAIFNYFSLPYTMSLNAWSHVTSRPVLQAFFACGVSLWLAVSGLMYAKDVYSAVLDSQKISREARKLAMMNPYFLNDLAPEKAQAVSRYAADLYIDSFEAAIATFLGRRLGVELKISSEAEPAELGADGVQTP